jgi:probable HAF family extracellular repeat protein
MTIRSAIQLVVLALVCCAAIAQQYTVQAIHTFGGGTSQASGINDHLQIVGLAELKGVLLSQAFLWSLDGTTNLGPPNMGSEALAINRTGQVVGCAVFPNQTKFHAFLWTQTGGLSDLGTLGGDTSCAEAINSNGQIVGSSFTGNDGTMHAFLWTQTGGMVDLGTLGGTSSEALGINDLGQVVGGSQDLPDSTRFRGFFWTQARGMRKLLNLTGAFGTEALGINNAGQVAGVATYSGKAANQRAVFWPHLLNGGIQNLGTLPGGITSGASAINVNGEVIGNSVDSQASHAFRWTASGGMQDLNDLIPAGSGWIISDAAAINSVGKIAANAMKVGENPSTRHALLLTPVKSTTDHSPIGH